MSAAVHNVGRFPRRWALIVVGILFTHTSLMILAVTVFVRNHNDMVIPDYYDKAVHWDQIKAAQQHDPKTAEPFRSEMP